MSESHNMKILSAVPVLYSYFWTKLCLSRINGEVLIIDNDSQENIKELIEPYPRKIVNAENIYVNPAWNQAMRYFMKTDFDLLAIISSDVAMMKNWESFVDAYFDNQIMIPKILTIPAGDMKKRVTMSSSNKLVTGDNPGVFILLTREMVEKVYPIPETLKIWFGDEWIFKILMNAGHEMRIYESLNCVHGNSRSVEGLGAHGQEVIKQDKKAWIHECTRIS